MSNFSDFIGGGGGGGSFPTIFLHNSQTWVPPQDGNIMIHVIGAGGSGCGSTVDTTIQSGAAGGYCRKNSLAVTTSGSFTVTIGAGGASVIGAAGAGAAGGTTSVAGTGLSSTLTATGGAGGALSNGTYTTAGVGSNGDLNTTGGRGGYKIGGGAVGLSGTGIDGGSAGDYGTTFGGRCDILGDFYSSSLGQLSGSSGGKGIYMHSSQDNAAGESEAGPLAGAGGMTMTGANASIAGHASIGGGGGFTFAGNVVRIHSGRGGQGCVVIQYIP
jgi:hypothetical protein